MCAKQSDSESVGLRYQLSDSADSFRADSSAFGMGSFSDFNRHLVFPLQPDFQTRLLGDVDGGYDDGAPVKPLLYRTLHAQLLDYVLELAGALGYSAVQSVRLAGAIRAAYRKHIARLFVR